MKQDQPSLAKVMSAKHEMLPIDANPTLLDALLQFDVDSNPFLGITSAACHWPA
jgi:hypothetical protein